MSGIYDLKLTMNETGIDKFVELYEASGMIVGECPAPD